MAQVTKKGISVVSKASFALIYHGASVRLTWFPSLMMCRKGLDLHLLQ